MVPAKEPKRQEKSETRNELKTVKAILYQWKVVPRCHADCKSKMVLESIAASCHAMKECMKNDENFNEYFEEEEFETSHWPCDRCMEALKTIKMFWKYLVQNIFRIKIPKEEPARCQRSDSVKALVNLWQQDIINQSLHITKERKLYKQSHCNKDTKLNYEKPAIELNEVEKTRTGDSEMNKIDLDRKHKFKRKKISRSSNSSNTKVKTTDASCMCNLSKKRRDTQLRKMKDNLREQSMLRSNVERLHRENETLREELDSIYKSFTWKAFYDPKNKNKYSVCLVPKEKESISENDVDSETVITMKECTHKNFRHVALLQILRKTNNPNPNEVLCSNMPHADAENPIEILNKVQSAFGDIVNKEIRIASDRTRHLNRSFIEATSQRVTSTRSVPSLTTLNSSTSDFVSAYDASVRK